MNDLFTIPEVGAGSEEMLLKALAAGYGTDAAQFAGGRALIPEDCETTMINAMREQQEDCKLMNTLKKTPVKSTVHQYNRRTSTGDYENSSVIEGGVASEKNQSIGRVTRDIKYLQEYREITEQMIVVDSFENAFEAEKLAGTINILKAAERMCFHGDASVVPTEWDGLLKQIRKSPADRRNVSDFRGKSITSSGEGKIADMVRVIYEAGGDANKIFFPPVLAMDIQELCRDRLRFGTNDRSMTPVFDSYPTPYGTIKFGETEGADKFFRVKGVISPSGSALQRPNAPSVTASAAADPQSQFTANDAGDYAYAVHAVNQYGISPAFVIPADVAVTSGSGVSLTITPDVNKPGTGFIICRSAKGGGQVMELCRIGIDESVGNTVFVDINDDLPGTADMVFLTEKKLQPVVDFYQLLPLRLYRMNPVNKLVTPFIIALWGALDLKVPEFCGLIKNIQYNGGMTY